MSNIIIAIDIIEYSPISYDFEDFKFIFSRNNQAFGDEISFMSKNKIIKKMEFEQKDIIFLVKAIRKDSLIGHFNFIIPYNNILLKKNQIFEKECLIEMNESTKRILSINNFNLKIKIHCDIKYINKENKKKISVNINKVKNEKKINNSIINKHYVYTKISQKNNDIEKLNKSQLNKEEIKKSVNDNKIKLIYNKPRNFANRKISKDLRKTSNSENVKDDSFEVEEELIKELQKIDNESSKLDSNLIKENPFENIANMNDINEMMLLTKNNIIKLLTHQQDYNTKLRNSIENYGKYSKLLKKYCQNYANNIKKLKILEKMQKINAIQKYLYGNHLTSNLSKIIEIKNKEIDLFKEINDNNNNLEDNSFEENLNINEIKENKNFEKNKSKHNYNLLCDLLKNCIIYYENNEKIKEIVPKFILEKYDLDSSINNDTNKNNNQQNYLDISLADNEDSITEMKNEDENDNKILKYIETNVNDEIDIELNDSLKEFYKNNKNIPIIKFKKIHDNNYNYGKMQIIVIEEGDIIKIKDDNGIFPLNKFLQQNSIIKNK